MFKFVSVDRRLTSTRKQDNQLVIMPSCYCLVEWQRWWWQTKIILSFHIRSFDNRFEVNRPPEPTLVLRWISKFFLFGALPSDTFKIKHTKNLKEIPSRHVLENLLEKSKHSCLYTSETHWQLTGILPIYNGRHAKSHNSRL